jgi:hypothetical protein
MYVEGKCITALIPLEIECHKLKKYNIKNNTSPHRALDENRKGLEDFIKSIISVVSVVNTNL